MNRMFKKAEKWLNVNQKIVGGLVALRVSDFSKDHFLCFFDKNNFWNKWVFGHFKSLFFSARRFAVFQDMDGPQKPHCLQHI